MKTVTIGGVEVPMLANAATSMVYQRIFDGQDILVEYNRLFGKDTDLDDPAIIGKSADIVKRIAFAMAKQAEFVGKEEHLMTLTEIDFLKWLSQWESTYALEEAGEQIMNVYTGDDTPTAEAKKEAAPQTDR